ncbi:IPT/TIG domain-containing protein [Herbiconiux ginsengi]|uniref:IPT/TIG domain-containing protein n=1 Tax=Herbiconiux ginsengi TaxID=381665 RepID=A0A1H3RN02_9MICO|nr:IPT/TIG domain-containing protein [Herbiconiux ginsengi]SDZ27003.1 IPT/TIG domain-containing protein [Herbiconiux ginsengi]
MRARTGTRSAASIAAFALLGGGALLVAAPAHAAEPGDAASIGGVASAQIALGPFQLVTDDIIGELAQKEPGSNSATFVDQTLLTSGQNPDFAEIVIGTVDTAVNSDESGSDASAIIGDSTFSLFGVTMVSVEIASAAVSCPVDGAPELFAETDDLTVLGSPVTLSDGAPTATRSVQLPSDVPTPDPTDGDATVDLSTLAATVVIGQVKEVDGQAISVALSAAVLIDGTYGSQVFDRQNIASLTLAETGCREPAAALSIAGVSPASGSTVGGETATITGSGFVEGTTVSFGSNAATGVVIDPSGDSLTAIVPAGTAGVASITVTNPDGATATLASAYDYAAPAISMPAAVEPGSPTLADTGSDVTPLVTGAAGALLLGALLATLARARRRRA